MYQFSPSLIKPPRWPIQPHLTAAPELHKDLLLGWAAQRVNEQDIGATTQTEWINLNTLSASPYGASGELNGVDQYIRGPQGQITGPLPLTVTADIIPFSLPSAATAVFNTNDPNGSYYYSGVQMLIYDGRIDVQLGDATGTVTSNRKTYFWDTTAQTNKRYTLTAIVRGANDVTIYLNGENVTSNFSVSGSASTLAFPTDTRPTAGFWTLFDRSDRYHNIQFLGAYVHGRELPERSVHKLHADPFAMLRPGPQLLPLLFGGAGATGSLVSLSGTIVAMSTLTGRASVRRSVTGTAAATSGLDGRLSALRGVQGTAAAQTSTSGRMSIRRAVKGTITAVTTLTGSLSKGAKVFLQGTIAATTSLTGRATVRRGVKGTVAAQSSTSGRLSIRRALSGTVQAVTATAGRVSVRRAVRGTIAVVTTLAGTLIKIAPTTRFSSTGRTKGTLRFSGRTRGRLPFTGRTKGK